MNKKKTSVVNEYDHFLNVALERIEECDGPDRKYTGEYHIAAQEIADLVLSKQAAYGNSFGKSGKIMEILYPKGIALNQANDALAVIRIIDKLFRIATAKDALGEDPFKDIAGYALLAVVRGKK